MVDTLRLGGIKLSGELVQIDVCEPNYSAEKFIALLTRIAEAEITVPHLHQRRSGKRLQSTLCLAAEDYLRVQKELDCLVPDGHSAVLTSVGSITLFPHRFDFGLFSRVLHALSCDNIPLFGVSTSVSALVIQTENTLLEKAVQATLRVCELPENHTPLRPVVLLGDQVVETVAVYWEPKIRIYGMDIQRDLCHLTLQCPLKTLRSDSLQQIGANEEKFRLLLAQNDEQRNFCCDLIIDDRWRDGLSTALNGCIADEPSAEVYCNDNVDMVSFHGPHFQDRFGIAQRVFAALAESGIELISSGCTGTSVNIVVAAGAGDLTVRCLEQICMIPSRENKQ
jgi:aspartokinase